MAIDDPRRLSRLLDLLPAVFQEDRKSGGAKFLGRFLLGFEQLLLGLPEWEAEGREADLASGAAGEPVLGLEQTIARLQRYFEPGAALVDQYPGRCVPEPFLDWLAGWVALDLREDWTPRRRRRLIERAVSLYRLRGTRRGVEAMLEVYTEPFAARVYELPPLQVGVHSTVGVDTVIGGGAPFFFLVQVDLPFVDPATARVQDRIARAIVDLQKPAHTYYHLTVVTPTFQIGVHSTVGVDTLVG